MPTGKAIRPKAGSRKRPGVRTIGSGARIALSLFIILFVAMTILWPEAVYFGIFASDAPF